MDLLAPGQIIRETYEVERLLGEGAFAQVFRVNHRFLGRQAMKVFKTPQMGIDEVRAMLSEAQLLSRLAHPNIIRVFDANTTQTSTGMYGFFTMEYMPAGTLADYLNSQEFGFIPVETSVEIIRQAARALSVAHSKNPPIIHRDIKPQNILIGYEGDDIRIRVSDFGLAKSVNPTTLMASARGTLPFKAPEAILQFRSDSCKGDVWSLGLTLYLLLTNTQPYADLDTDGVLDAACYSRPLLAPSRFNLEVDEKLDRIVLRALAIRPEDRYPTAKEFLADLEAWQPQEDGPIVEPRPRHSKTSDASEKRSHSSRKEAEMLVARAFSLAGQASTLSEAVQLMEAAFKKWPDLRSHYEYQYNLWRSGVVM